MILIVKKTKYTKRPNLKEDPLLMDLVVGVGRGLGFFYTDYNGGHGV